MLNSATTPIASQRHTAQSDAPNHHHAPSGHASAPRKPNTARPDDAPASTFAVSFFNHKFDTTPQPQVLSWPQLGALLRLHTTRAAKDGRLISPTRFDGKRRNNDAREISLLFLDFDGKTTLNAVRDALSGLAAIIYTTHSHSAKNERYRAVVRLWRPIAADDWPDFWARAAHYFGAESADETCKDKARFYYLPACPKETAALAYAETLDGAPLKPETLPELVAPAPQPAPPLKTASNGHSATNSAAYVLAALRNSRAKMDAVTDGQRHDLRMKLARTLGGFIHTGHISESDITNALAVNFGPDEAGARRTIADGIEYGKAEPIEVPAPQKATTPAPREIIFLNSDAPEPSKKRSAPQKAPAAPDATTPAPSFEYSTGDALDGCLSEIEWLWPAYIPRGFVTLLVGEQDGGKSTVAQSLCRTLLSGGLWPDGTRCEAVTGALLWLDTEGSLALFRQRGKKWKMPMQRFIFPADPLQELRVDNAADWLWIETAIERFKPALVVLDALSGSHSGKENGNDEMKEVLKRLAGLAQRHQIAIVVIHHLAKAPAGVPDYPITLNRIRGASAITQYCRSVVALTSPDPHNPTARRLDVIKLNIARKPAPVGYELTDDGPAWGHAPEPPQPRRAADEAADFLRTAMGAGLRPSDEVADEARTAGIGDNALKQAKKLLGVKSQREGGKDGKWFLTWENTPKNAPEAEK